MVEDRFIGPAITLVNTLARGPHAACKLEQATDLDRPTVDRTLRWLKRRRLVIHEGAWRLTELGRIAYHVNHS